MTFPLMDRTRRLTEEALGEANLDWPRLDGVLLVGGSTRMPMVRSYVSQMAGKPPRTGVNVDEVVALGAAIQAAIEVGQQIGDAVPRLTLSAGGAPATAGPASATSRRVTDVMSHSLGTIAVSPDGSEYVNDIVIRRNLPIPARNTKSYLHETHGGSNARLEVYLTQGESATPLDCTILGKYVFDGIHPTNAEVTIDVGLSYDSNGVVQVQAVQRDTAQRLPMTVEPVPDDLSWLGRPPETSAVGGPVRADPRVSADRRVVEHDGPAASEAQTAAREFLSRCDLTTMEVGLISFSTLVALQSPATSNLRRLHAAVHRLEAEGSTNLTDALEMARGQLVADDRKRYIVLLTDGYPDAPESAHGTGAGRARAGDRDRGDRHRRRRSRLPAPARQQRTGVDLRAERRAGSDIWPHCPRDCRGRARTARDVMSRATLARADFGLSAKAVLAATGCPARSARGLANFRHAYDLAVAGGLGALFGLYLYVELVQAESVYVRDACAGLLIGGSLGIFLNAYGPFRDGAWLKLARAVAWGAPAAAIGGAIGLVAGELVIGVLRGGLMGRALSWAVLGLGIGLGQGLADRSRERLDLWFDRRRARWVRRRLPL